jgi:hypothetical protein
MTHRTASPIHAAPVAKAQKKPQRQPGQAPIAPNAEVAQAEVEHEPAAEVPAFLQLKCASCAGAAEPPPPPPELPASNVPPYLQHRHGATSTASAGASNGVGSPIRIAQGGAAGASDPLPHLPRIQAAFGHHDVTGVRTRTGGAAAEASRELGAHAYTLGHQIGFRSAPDLHLAAHEAAHTVQQRAGVQLAGGVGQAGDRHERHADAVADAVVAGRSAVPLLDALRSAAGSATKGSPATTAPGLQRACACGGTCPRCATQAMQQARPEAQLQFELDVLAPRRFSPAPLEPAAAGGGAGGGPTTQGPQAGGEGGSGAAPAPGASNPAGGGGSAPGSGSAAGSAGAPGADPVGTAATALGTLRCPPIPDRAPPEAASPAPAPEPCTETLRERRTPERIAQDEENQRRGAPPPGEPAAVAMEAKGQVQAPPSPAAPAAPPAAPPPAPTECAAPPTAPAAPAAATAPAPITASEPAAPRWESPFDPARDEAITAGELRRGERIAELDLAQIDADAAAERLDAQGAASVQFAAPEQPDKPDPAAVQEQASASEMASRAIAEGVSRARSSFDTLREDVPRRVAEALRQAKDAIETARSREAGAVMAHFEQARKDARREAGQSLAQIDLQCGLTVMRALADTLATIGRIEQGKAGGIEGAGSAETDSLGRLDAALSEGQSGLRQVATERGNDAIQQGRAKFNFYKGGRINRRDNWHDGRLTDRRADARAKAALTTAAGFRDSFAQEAENQAFQLGRSKPAKCARIVAAAFATRHAITEQAGRFTGLAQTALAPQLAAALDTRAQLRSAVHGALARQLLTLDNQQQVQVQAVDDTAYLQGLALDEEAHAAAARLLRSGAQASDEISATYAGMRRLMDGQPVVPPAVLAPALALALARERIDAAQARMDVQLGIGLGLVETTLAARVPVADKALSDLAADAGRSAGRAAAAFGASMVQMRTQAAGTFTQVAVVYQAQLDALAGSAESGFACALAQLRATASGAVQEVTDGVREQRRQLETSFQGELRNLDREIARNACEAAKKEQPAWKEVVAVILIIVIIIVAIVLTGPLALALAGGTAATLGSMIVAGAIIGALSAAAIQVVNNWASGQELSRGVLRAAVTGAIAGALGGALGGFAGGASSLGGAIVRQAAVDFAGNMASQLATGLIFDGRLSLPHYSVQDLAISVFMAALFVRRNPGAGRPHGESYVTPAHTGASGVRGAAWRGLARAQSGAHGVAQVLMPGGALRPVRADAVEPAGPVRAEPVSAETAPGARPEPAAGPVAEPAGSPDAAEPGARPAAEPGARATPEPAARPGEPAAQRPAQAAERAPVAEPSAAEPLGPRPESVTPVGVGDHKVYARRGLDGTEIGMCSSACGPLKGKIDDMLPHASDELRARLSDVRERATRLEGQVDRGEVARGPELDARIGELTAELRGIAAEHPALRGLMDGPPPPPQAAAEPTSEPEGTPAKPADAAEPATAREPAPTEPPKTEPAAPEAPRTEQQQAAGRLAELQQQRGKAQTDLDALRVQEAELSAQRATAAREKRAAVNEENQATTSEAKQAARTRAREALARERTAQAELDALASPDSLQKQIARLDADIQVESIKADPSSRARLPCFAAGTPVHTPAGPRAIETLLPGDTVWAWSFAQAAPVPRRVTQLHQHLTLHWMAVAGAEGGVHATGAHRFFDAGLREWTEAARLQPGMCLLCPDGSASVLQAAHRIELGAEARSYNLSVDADCTYFVGPGWLVHNEAVDLGLGGGHVIYRGTNPRYPGKVYIGQVGELDARGRPRGVEARQGEHRATAAEALRRHEAGIEILSAENKAFYEFMLEATLEPIVKGIATEGQAKYLEQLNMDIERLNGEVELVNRREEIVSSRERIEAEIRNDPAVKAKGYCP